MPTKPIKDSWKYQCGLCSGRGAILKTEDVENNTIFLMNCQIPFRGEAALELRSKMSLILDQLAFFCSCICFVGGGLLVSGVWGAYSRARAVSTHTNVHFSQRYTDENIHSPDFSFVRTDSCTKKNCLTGDLQLFKGCKQIIFICI